MKKEPEVQPMFYHYYIILFVQTHTSSAFGFSNLLMKATAFC